MNEQAKMLSEEQNVPMATVVTMVSSAPNAAPVGYATAQGYYNKGDGNNVVAMAMPAAMAVQPQAGVTQETLGVIYRIRKLAHVMLLFAFCSLMTAGMIFVPMIDLILIFANYILILTTTAENMRGKLFDAKEQNGCCGIRHVRKLSIACLVFLIICSVSRYETTVYYWLGDTHANFPPGQTFPNWVSTDKAIIVLQALASLFSGITAYCLIVIASLTSASTDDQCFTSGSILHDPVHPASAFPRQRRCPTRITFIVLVASVIPMALMLRRLSSLTEENYCYGLKSAYKGVEGYLIYQTISAPCCQEVQGYNVTCTRIGNNTFPPSLDSVTCQCENPTTDTNNYNCPSGKVGVDCFSKSSYGCPAKTTAFLPDDGFLQGFNQTLANFFAVDVIQAPSCLASPYCYDATIPVSVKQFPDENDQFAEIILCPHQMYSCVETAKTASAYCVYDPSYPGFSIVF